MNHLRVEKAKQLLDSTDMTVNTIADEVGLANTNYFIRLFRKVTGMTPGEYRRSRR
jgi:two-component system response regulator YesN